MAQLNASPAAVATPQVRWSGWRFLVTLGLLVAIALAVLGFGDGTRVTAAARGLWGRPELLGIFLASYSAAFYLRAVAWRLLLPSVMETFRLFSILQVALLANHLFPTKAGEVVRIGLLARRGVAPGAAISSTVLARLLDFISLCLIALIVGPLAGGRLDLLLGLLALPIASIALGAAACLVLASGHLATLVARLPRRIARLVGDAQVALATTRPHRLLAAFSIIVPSWLLESGALWATAEAAGVPLPFTVAAAATAITIAFQGFQVTPGGIGLYEASLTGALALYGIDPATGLALAVATHGLKFAYSYLVGFPCLVAEGADSLGLGLPGIELPRRLTGRLGFGSGTAPTAIRPLAARALEPLRSIARWLWAAPALAFASVAVLAMQVLVGPKTASVGGLLLGIAMAVPLGVLGGCHRLPRHLTPAILVVPLAFVALFGIPAPAAGLGAVALGAIAAVSRRGIGPLSILWAGLLAQAVVAGAEQPLAIALFGAAALVIVVLVRQCWYAHHPLPKPAAPAAGGTVAVVIPVHDEAASIGAVVASVPRSALRALGFETRIIVVDDGSTDGSGELARAAGADVVIRKPDRGGLGAAVRTGLAAARECGASAAVYLDGDGEYDAAEIPAVVGPILRGEADYVLGSRFPSAASQMRWSRRWGNRVFTLLLSLLAGRPVRDGQTGFRAFSARALAQLEIVHDYNYAQVLTLDLLRKRLRLAEVPIGYRLRRHGRSFIRYPEYLRRVVPAIVYEVLAP